MVCHKWNNEYDVSLFTLSLMLEHFEKEDQLFAAQCIWWLASIILCTEILTYYWWYTIFPSNYIDNLVITPLPHQSGKGSLVPESDFPVLDIAMEISNNNSDQETTVHPARNKLLPGYRNTNITTVNTKRLGELIQRLNLSITEHEATFWKQSTKHRAHTRALCWEWKLDIEGDYALT